MALQETNVNSSSVENIEDSVEREAQALREQVANAPDDEAREEILKDKTEKLGMSFDDVVKLQGAIDNGLPLDEVIANIVNNALPIWLKEQEDHTIIPTGYDILNDLIPMIDRENGSITFDYQNVGHGDAKSTYFGSTDEQIAKGNNLTDLWHEPALDVSVETYYANRHYHKTIITFKPLFTASHRDTYLFIAQMNNVVKRLGEAYKRYHLALKGRYLWLGADGDTGITESNTDVVFAPIALKDPDITITAENSYDMVQQLNTLIENLVIPSDTLFADLGATKRQAEFMVKGMKNPMYRVLDPKRMRIIAPNSFKNAYNLGVRAGAFNMAQASLNDDITKAFKFLPYANTFGAKYANITGLDESIKATGKDEITGSCDLLIITPETYQMISQYDGTETFNAGNFTTAINNFKKMGFAMRKNEEDFVLQIHLEIKPATTPTK